MGSDNGDLSLGRAASVFLRDLARVVRETVVTDLQGTSLTYEAGSTAAVGAFRHSSAGGGKVGFVGNGGSAAIASHMAIDMWKNGGIEALAFNDPSLLTCLSNDCGFENVFSMPVRRFMRKGDTLVVLSSSGRSRNILESVAAARDIGCQVVTLSGFDEDNPLRTSGDINFYIPSGYYGLVEAGHLAILHSLLDAHMDYPIKGRRRRRAAVAAV